MHTVLVVDDDEDIVAFIVDALTGEGYRVLSAVDGASLQIARDLHPDVILLDIMMPGMDGVEVSHRLRADPQTSGIPIIAMSAGDRLQTTGALMPVDDRLPKPFRLTRLYELVACWAGPAT
jgi:two-component system cell cycle response regulator